MESLQLSVFALARYFISRSQMQTEHAITHLKLQKLVYYAQAYILAFMGISLFTEQIQAWRHGPVCPELYEQYKQYSYQEINPNTIGSIDFRAAFPHINTNAMIDTACEIIDEVWDVYGAYTGSELETMTHQEEPWINAKTRGRNVTILPENIETYFKNVTSGKK